MARNSEPELPLREIDFHFVRSSGAGGQNVNKVASKAVLRWNVSASRSISAALRERLLTRHARRITVTGDLVLSSQRFRDQPRNVADCLEKLRVMLRDAALEEKPRRATRPTRASKLRRVEAKRHRSRTKSLRGGPSRDA
ncbi:Peptidyl-tRNA hydrolase ArfB [Myxococcaceae bacterium]|jgi:ribosome-associated protein|nr:Peptidyl-tRNA hydrolase ArfB [Myxococcaceae bacterium]